MSLAFNPVREIEHESAIKIQSVFRGYLDRKKFEDEVGIRTLQAAAQVYLVQTSLPPLLIKKAIERIVQAGNKPDSWQMSRASSGITPVFYPEGLPVVFKLSRDQCGKRLQQMGWARRICIENCYTHLVIPRASIYGDFLIERRLPIRSGDTKEHIGFYLENLVQFTEAVKEFAGFLCKTHFGDLSKQKDPLYALVPEVPGQGRIFCFMRYDNVPLYVDGNKYLIGLIDLEHARPRKEDDKTGCFHALREAVRFFPYHFDEIMEVGMKLDPSIFKDYSELKALSDKAREYFDACYLQHKAFVQRHGIELDTPTKMASLTPERMERLKGIISKKIRSESSDYQLCEFLNGVTFDQMEAVGERVLESTMSSINGFSLEKLQSDVKQLQQREDKKDEIQSVQRFLGHAEQVHRRFIDNHFPQIASSVILSIKGCLTETFSEPPKSIMELLSRRSLYRVDAIDILKAEGEVFYDELTRFTALKKDEKKNSHNRRGAIVGLIDMTLDSLVEADIFAGCFRGRTQPGCCLFV